MLNRKTILSIAVAVIFSISALPSEAYPQDLEIKERLSKIEYEMISEGNYQKATEKLLAILEYSPGNARAYMSLGMAYYGLMKYEKAYEYLKKTEITELKKEARDVLSYSIARMEENRTTLNEMEKARSGLDSATAPEKEIINRQIASGHARLLDELMGRKRYYPIMVTAHVACLKENAADFPEIYKISGDIYYSAMFYKKATEDYQKAIEGDPENAGLHRILADCLVAMGDFDQAQEYYDKAIVFYKEEGGLRNRQIISELERIKKALPKKYKDIAELIKSRKYAKAEAICRRKISLNPGDYVAISQLGEVYWQRNDRKMAEKLFKKVVKRVPDYPVARFLLGKAYFFRRKYKAAETEFEIFKEKMALLPKMDEDTVDFYVSVLHNIGYMYSTIKRYDIMLKEGQKALQLKPEDQITHYNLAVCYYNYDRKVSLAYKELQKVIEIDDSTELARRAAFFIDYIRRNPDPRFIPDFSFILEDI